MKLTLVIAEFLKLAGFNEQFAVTGGAAVHIIDSLSQAGIKPVFTHHEQAAALSADAAARLTGFGLCVTTTGPGVTNALTGLLCSWQDSVPTLFISGQSRTGNLAKGFKVRQSGTQHLDVEPIVRSLVKNFVQISNPVTAVDEIADLIRISKSDRQGPVWVDLPLDLQLQDVPDEQIDSILKSALGKIQAINSSESENLKILVEDWLDRFFISNAKKPLLILGRGTNNVEATKIRSLVDILGIPVATTWGSAFEEAEAHPNWIGRIGVSGMRGTNQIAMQSDCIISIGARWGQSTVGTDLNAFAPRAEIIICDIDQEELDLISSKRDLFTVKIDANKIVNYLLENEFILNNKFDDWLEKSKKISQLNSSEYSNEKSQTGNFLDMYQFLISLQKSISSEELIYVIDGGGTIVYGSMQTLINSGKNSIVIPSAAAPMGTGIPHAVGAWISTSRPIVCLLGDGSLMMNLQEIQTLKTYNIPAKVMILSNGGYRSIRSTQDQFLSGNHLGSSVSGGIEIPSIEKIANSMGIRYTKLSNLVEIEKWAKNAKSNLELEIVEVLVDPNQELHPRVAFRLNKSGSFQAATLDDMDPELDIISEISTID